jgi:DNA-binding NarL/FixJ family response regulator
MIMAKIRVFLTDDHTVLRDGLALLIDQQTDMEVVGTAGDGASALAQIDAIQPDIVVMDVSMPDISGIEATKQICLRWPQIQVVALTRHTEPGYMRQLLLAGARAYVLKQASTDELIGAIRAVVGGGVYLDPTLTRHVADAFLQSQRSRTALAANELSEREADVVRLVAQGFGNKEVATQLGISVKTVDTYKARAMEKLGLYSRAALVRYALQQGWLDQG